MISEARNRYSPGLGVAGVQQGGMLFYGLKVYVSYSMG